MSTHRGCKETLTRGKGCAPSPRPKSAACIGFPFMPLPIAGSRESLPSPQSHRPTLASTNDLRGFHCFLWIVTTAKHCRQQMESSIPPTYPFTHQLSPPPLHPPMHPSLSPAGPPSLVPSPAPSIRPQPSVPPSLPPSPVATAPSGGLHMHTRCRDERVGLGRMPIMPPHCTGTVAPCLLLRIQQEQHHQSQWGK